MIFHALHPGYHGFPCALRLWGVAAGGFTKALIFRLSFFSWKVSGAVLSLRAPRPEVQ